MNEEMSQEEAIRRLVKLAADRYEKDREAEGESDPIRERYPEAWGGSRDEG